MIYLLIFLAFILILIAYFQIAQRYAILDKPNERSSHSLPTIRGGGVIFLFAAICACAAHSEFLLPLSALMLIGIISLIDDINGLSSYLRLLFHIISFTILWIYFHVFQIMPLFAFLLLYLISIAVINAYNFMDGINGITGTYSLVILAGLQFINLYRFSFIEEDMIWFPLLACLAFLFFNFRNKARCFAGDVGSITVSFWIVILLFQLILRTHNFIYILFLSVYGVDAGMTIIARLYKKENIFKPHRQHFYQILANEQKIPHLVIAVMYSLLQLVIIIFIILGLTSPLLTSLIVLIPLIAAYIMLKPILLHSPAKN